MPPVPALLPLPGELHGIVGHSGEIHLVHIGDEAFRHCRKLTTVTFADGLETIGNGAFRDCPNLDNLVIPATVTKVGWEAFVDCKNLKTVHVLGTPQMAFYSFDGTPLADIYCWNETPGTVELPEGEDEPHSYLHFSTATLHVPAEAIETYRNAEPWRRFDHIVPITSHELSNKPM